jgi:hypothetical protein
MNVEEVVGRLATATAEELDAAIAFINAEGRTLAAGDLSEDNVTRLEALSEARTTLQAEKDRRAALANRASSAAAAFADEPDNPADNAPADDKPTATGMPDGGQDQRQQQVDNAPPRPGDGDGPTNDHPDGTGDGVQASGRTPLGTIGKNSKKADPPKSTALVVNARATSLAALPQLPAGTELDRWTLADASLDLHNRLARSTVSGKQYVARLSYDYPPERVLQKDVAAGVNSARIDAVTEPTALTAAGGLCAPLETLYDINVVGVTQRPIRDALARFAVDRGGIQYRMPMDALTMTDGLGIWTVDNDEAVTGDPETDPAKTCAVIDCPGVVDAVVYSTYLCLQYPNFSARFDREWVDATTRAAMVAWARFAENQLLSRILAGSKLIYQDTVVSATRDVLVAIDKTVAYYRNRHRLDSMVPLRMILPRWVLDLFRADMARGFPGDLEALAVADATIMGWFRARGVNVTFHLDGLAGATVNSQAIPNQFYANVAAGAVIPEFIDKIDAVLFAEGDWLYLDGGTLDLGLVRDSALNRINRYQQFVENFEGVAFNGIESLRMVLTVFPRGAVVGTIPPLDPDTAVATNPPGIPED